MVDADAGLDLGEDGGAAVAHLAGVALHDVEVGADGGREVRLVDDEQVALRDAGPALARDLVATAHVDHVDDVVRELAAVVGGQVVASALDEEQVGSARSRTGAAGPARGVQVLERRQVRADVLAHGGMRTAARLDGTDPRRRQRPVPHQELGVLPREDIVGHRGDAVLLAQCQAQGQHQRRFAGANGAVEFFLVSYAGLSSAYAYPASAKSKKEGLVGGGRGGWLRAWNTEGFGACLRMEREEIIIPSDTNSESPLVPVPALDYGHLPA